MVLTEPGEANGAFDHMCLLLIRANRTFDRKQCAEFAVAIVALRHIPKGSEPAMRRFFRSRHIDIHTHSRENGGGITLESCPFIIRQRFTKLVGFHTVLRPSLSCGWRSIGHTSDSAS